MSTPYFLLLAAAIYWLFIKFVQFCLLYGRHIPARLRGATIAEPSDLPPELFALYEVVQHELAALNYPHTVLLRYPVTQAAIPARFALIGCNESRTIACNWTLPLLGSEAAVPTLVEFFSIGTDDQIYKTSNLSLANVSSSRKFKCNPNAPISPATAHTSHFDWVTTQTKPTEFPAEQDAFIGNMIDLWETDIEQFVQAFKFHRNADYIYPSLYSPLKIIFYHSFKPRQAQNQSTSFAKPLSFEDRLLIGLNWQLESHYSPKQVLLIFLLSSSFSLVAATLLFGWVPGAAIIVTLLFHELGHFVAMRAFGYTGTLLAILPSAGFAMGTKGKNATWLSEACVILAGPVPGIILGIALFFSYSESNFLQELISMLLIINIANLFPLYPLDGGRLAVILAGNQGGTFGKVLMLASTLGLVVLGLMTQSSSLFVFGLIALLPFLLFRANAESKILAALRKVPAHERSQQRLVKEIAAVVEQDLKQHPSHVMKWSHWGHTIFHARGWIDAVTLKPPPRFLVWGAKFVTCGIFLLVIGSFGLAHYGQSLLLRATYDQSEMMRRMMDSMPPEDQVCVLPEYGDQLCALDDEDEEDSGHLEVAYPDQYQSVLDEQDYELMNEEEV